MSEITTYSGIYFDPLKAEEKHIAIEDIAHSLSLLCRANGHVSHLYTVAQHCLNCSREAKARGYSTELQLLCLLHDAAEAYLADVIRPIKDLLAEYQKEERKLMEFIWEKYLGRPAEAEEYEKVFQIDDEMLVYEFHTLMPMEIREEAANLISEPDIAFRNPKEVEQEYLQTFQQLLEHL